MVSEIFAYFKFQRRERLIMNDFKDFVTPPDHTDFLAKKLFGNVGEIMDGSIAYLHANGGGPTKLHTHEHDHLFIVIKGEAKIILNDSHIILHENESYLVKGSIPHSVWNNQEDITIMVGMSVK